MPLPGLWPIAISLPAETVHVHADPRLAFEVLTAFDAGAGSPHVIDERPDGSRLVEFHVRARGLFGRVASYTTQEVVTVEPPERIHFTGVKGPLPLLRDTFTLEREGNCTNFSYQSTFGVRGWWPGWVIGRIYVKPVMERFIRTHLAEVKETIEARAKKSRLYPYRDCGEVRDGADQR